MSSHNENPKIRKPKMSSEIAIRINDTIFNMVYIVNKVTKYKPQYSHSFLGRTGMFRARIC